MLEKELKPYLVAYINGHYEEVDDHLVFAYNEAHAIATILQTFDDAKFVYDSKSLVHWISTKLEDKVGKHAIFLNGWKLGLSAQILTT